MHHTRTVLHILRAAYCTYANTRRIDFFGRPRSPPPPLPPTPPSPYSPSPAVTVCVRRPTDMRDMRLHNSCRPTIIRAIRRAVQSPYAGTAAYGDSLRSNTSKRVRILKLLLFIITRLLLFVIIVTVAVQQELQQLDRRIKSPGT